MATIEAFWGDRPDEQSERDFLAQLEEDLASRNVSATILANFYTHSRSRQVDFLIVTENHACVVELKNYTGLLIGGENGHWSRRLPGGTLEVIDRQNPYNQAFLCKMAVSDDLHALVSRDGGIPRPLGGRKFYTQLDGVVCIFPRLEAGSQVPGDYKVKTLGYAQFVEYLTTAGPHPDWTREHWFSCIRLLGLTDTAGPSVQALAATTAQELAGTYRQRFDGLYRQDLHELVPLPLTRDDQTIEPAALLSLLSARRYLQLVGPSGTGKSHLTKHTVLDLPEQAWLPIFIDTGMYEGRLSTLLNRSVARFVTRTAEDLIRAASINGQAVLLVVDGFNECPQPLQERLTGDLAAHVRRTGAATLITSQAAVRVSDALAGALVHVGRLDEDSRKAVLTSYGAPEIVDLTEAFSTAYELSIAAECAAELESPLTRAALFSAFIRKRLGQTSAPAELRSTLRRLAMVMDDRLATSLPLDQVWREAERDLVARSVPMSVLDDIFQNTITISQQGRFSFTHELLGRYLAAEALTLHHRQSSELSAELRKPRHRDLRQLTVELEDSVLRAEELLAGLADDRLYLRALRGESGRAAAEAAEAAARALLQAVTEGMVATTFTVQSQFELSVTGGYQLSDGDRALLSAVGTSVSYGQFVPEVAALLDATDGACLRTLALPVEEGTKRPAISEVLAAVMVGSSDRSGVAAHIINEAVRPARYAFRYRTTGYEPRISLEALTNLVDGATARSYARLLLLCELLQQTEDLQAVRLAVRVLRLCWDSRAYHLRLDALMMIQSFAAATRGQAVRQQIIDVLDGLETNHLMLSSQLVETLYSYDLIEPPDDEDSVLARIAAVLADPEDSEARQWAYSIVSNQFEDVVAAPYVAAIEKLTADERTALFTMAALGSPSYGFWNDWLLKELIKFGDRATLPAFEHWATDLYTENAMTQEVISCYTLAVQGWAQFMDTPPRLVNAEFGDRAAWECYGAIIFWLYRPGLTADELVERTAPYWQRLQGELRVAAVDPLYWLMHASRVRFDTPLIGKVLQTFPDEVRPIVEWSLEQWDSLTLTSIFRFAVHDRQDYLISMLAAIGNARSVELLRTYVDDPTLGSPAIRAIKQLTGERT